MKMRNRAAHRDPIYPHFVTILISIISQKNELKQNILASLLLASMCEY